MLNHIHFLLPVVFDVACLNAIRNLFPNLVELDLANTALLFTEEDHLIPNFGTRLHLVKFPLLENSEKDFYLKKVTNCFERLECSNFPWEINSELISQFFGNYRYTLRTLELKVEYIHESVVLLLRDICRGFVPNLQHLKLSIPYNETYNPGFLALATNFAEEQRFIVKYVKLSVESYFLDDKLDQMH